MCVCQAIVYMYIVHFHARVHTHACQANGTIECSTCIRCVIIIYQTTWTKHWVLIALPNELMGRCIVSSLNPSALIYCLNCGKYEMWWFFSSVSHTLIQSNTCTHACNIDLNLTISYSFCVCCMCNRMGQYYVVFANSELGSNSGCFCVYALNFAAPFHSPIPRLKRESRPTFFIYM